MPEIKFANITRIADVILYYCIIAFAFLLPLFVLPIPWASVPQGKILITAFFILVSATAWIVGSVAERRITVPLNPLLAAVIFLPVTYAVSALLSDRTITSIVSGDAQQSTVASMLIFCAIAIFVAYASRETKRVYDILQTLLLSGIFVALFQILKLIFPAIDLFGALQGTASSLVGSWHDLAIFLSTCFLISCGLMETVRAERKITVLLLRSVAVLSFALLLIVNYKDTWLALSGAAILFAIVRALRSYIRHGQFLISIRAASLWIGLACALGLVGIGSTFIYAHLPTRVQVSQTEVRPSWQGTLLVSQRPFDGTSFVFGSGPNTFMRQWARFKPYEVNATNFWNVDFPSGVGIVPTAFVTMGVVGALAWIFLMLALMWSAYRALRDYISKETVSLKSVESVFVRITLVVTCIFLMFFHVIYVPGIAVTMFMFLLFGLVAAGESESQWRHYTFSSKPISVVVMVITAALLLLIYIACAVSIRTMLSTLVTYRAAIMYQKTNDISRASSMIDSAVRIDPGNVIAQRAALEVGLLRFREQMNANTGDASSTAMMQKTLSDTIAHGLKAVSLDQSNYQNWLSLAGLYQSLAGVGIQGAYQQAQNAYLNVASTSPTNPIPFVQLGQIAMAQGDTQSALKYLGKAIELKPNLPLPYYLRSQMEASQSNFAPAVQDAANAAQLASQDPVGWYNLGVILFASGDYPNAALSLEKANTLQKDYSDALFALTLSYDKLGRAAEALTLAQQVSILNPNDLTVIAVVKNLTAGKAALYGLQESPKSTSTKKIRK